MSPEPFPSLDALLEFQEASWKSGERISVERLVETSPQLCQDREIVLELICNEAILREESKETPTLADYQQRFPQLAEALAIQWEFDRLLTTSHPPRPDEFVLRQDLKQVAHYEILEEIGRGASGIIHRAWDPRLKRIVAIKRLRSGLDAAPVDLERMRTEVEAIARIRHENIVEIYDVGEHHGLPYFAMEYCKGKSLVELLQERTLSAQVAAELVSKIAHAIAVAHQAGVIHRDLKPGNILIVARTDISITDKTACDSPADDAKRNDAETDAKERPPDSTLLSRLQSLTRSTFRGYAGKSIGSQKESAAYLTVIPKVTDFGLAKLLDQQSGATATGSVLGTPAYMAPEQALGNAKRVGPAADIYALGAILYECLTGRPPFRGASLAETLEQVRHHEPISVRNLEPQIPIDLETITHKCLRKDPGRRYASAEDLADDLDRFLHLKPILARRETWPEAALRTFRRFPVASSLAIGTLLLLSLIAVGSLMFAQSLHRARIASDHAAREAKLGQAEALVGRAHGTRLSGRPGQRFEALDALTKAIDIGRELRQPKEWFEEIRNEAIAAILLPDIRIKPQWPLIQPFYRADLSSDGRLLARWATKDEVVVRRVVDLSVICRIRISLGVTYLRFANADTLLIQQDVNGPLEAWGLKSAPYLRWKSAANCNWVDITADHRHVGVGTSNSVTVFETDTGKIVSEMNAAPFSRDTGFAFHPNLPLIVLYSYFHPEIQVRNWRNSDVLLSTKLGEKEGDYQGYTGAAWSPSGRELIVVNGHEDATHWFQCELTTPSIRWDHTVRKPDINLHAGGGPTVTYHSGHDRLIRMGWINRMQLLHATNGACLAQSTYLIRTFGYRYPPPDFPMNSPGLFFEADNPQYFGPAVIAEGYEFEYLATPSKMVSGNASYDPTGTLIIVVNGEEVFAFNAKTGDLLIETKWANVSGATSVQFYDREHFLTSGHSGTLLWDFEVKESDQQVTMVLQVPRRIELPRGQVVTSTSRDGAVIAAGIWNGFGAAPYAGGWLKAADEPAPRKLISDNSCADCAVSPDGRNALFNVNSDLYIWNAGVLIKEDCSKTLGIHSKLRFGNGNTWWLGGGMRAATGFWQPNPKNPAGTPWDISVDGTQIATSMANGMINLCNATTGHVVARFETPHGAGFPLFSPNQEKLLVHENSDPRRLRVIDLRLIREQLKKLGLDWDSPPFPNQAHDDRPVHVELSPELAAVHSLDELLDKIDDVALVKAKNETADRDTIFAAAMAATREQDYDISMSLLERACDLFPLAVTTHQWKAFVYAAQEQFAEAIHEADRVLEKVQDGNLQLLRAEWNYRLGNLDPSIADCNKVIEDRPLLAKFAFALRSLCYAQRGDAELAAKDRSSFLELTRNDVASLDVALFPLVSHDISLRAPALARMLAEKMVSLGVELDARHLVSIGFAHFWNHELDDAAATFQRVLNIPSKTSIQSAEWAMATLGLCLVHFRSGQPEVAKNDYKRFLQVQTAYPNSAENSEFLRWLRIACERASRSG